MLGRELTWVATTAIVTGVLTILIPATWGEQLFNVIVIFAFWPLAYRMWVETPEAQPVVAAPPTPA